MTLILLPLGSCEQHGAHLPRDTDSRIAVAISTAAATRLATVATGDVWVAPVFGYGASWEHHGFDGLLSLNDAIMHDALVELAHSADWSDGIVFVNGHGGNAPTVARAVRSITADGRHALSWSPRVVNGDLHAGRTETSLMLAIAPDVVDLTRTEAGWTGPVGRQPVRELSPNGVLGDPSGATAHEGITLLDGFVDDLVQRIAAWQR